MMENPEEVLAALEEWGRRGAGAGKPGRAVPRALEEHLARVARTGDPVFAWAALRPLLKDKLVASAAEFRDACPGLDVPPAPNVEPFDYEASRAALLERLDAFTAAPFTVQRLCELLAAPRAHYSRIDKFMRAVEKNVLVVSTREPGPARRPDEPRARALNGADRSPDCGLDVDMEDASWRETDPLASDEPERADADRVPTSSVTPPRASPPEADQMEAESAPNENVSETAPAPQPTAADVTEPAAVEKSKEEPANSKLEPEIENIEMEVAKATAEVKESLEEKESEKAAVETIEHPTSPKNSCEESNSEPITREPEQKPETIMSGEDSSSSNSSETTDGESERSGESERGCGDAIHKSPERSGASEGENSSCDVPEQDEDSKGEIASINEQGDCKPAEEIKIQSDDYTVSDVKSELPQTAKIEEPSVEEPVKITEDQHVTTEGEMTDVTPEIKTPIDEPMQTETTEKVE